MYDVTTSYTASFSILTGVSLLTAVSLGLEDIWRTAAKETINFTEQKNKR